MSTADIGIKLSLDGASQVSAGLNTMAQGFDAVKSKAETVASAIGGLPGVLAALTGVASAGAFLGILKGSIESAAALNDLSIQTGATVEALSGLASIGKLSGQSAESIAQAMNKLASNMAGASEESKGAGKALEAIGLSLAQLKSMSPEAQMQAIAGAMDGFSDGSGKAAVAMALFGKEGAKMLPFMKDLAGVGELSAKVTAAQAAAADNLSDNLTKVSSSTSAWAKELSMGIIPALDEAAQAALDVTNGTGGLREEVRKLVDDGTITEWARMAVTAATYVMDAFSGLVNVVSSVGKTIGATLAAGAETFGGLQDAFKKALSGDFSGALASMEAANRRASAIWSELGNDMSRTWSDSTLGQRLRARLEDLRAIKTEAVAAKAQVNFDNTSASADRSVQKADQQAEAYKRLMAAIAEKTAAQALEAESGAKLTEADKLRLEIQKQVETGVLRMADAQSHQTQAALDALDAREAERRSMEAYYKQVDELAKATQQETTAAMNATQALREQLKTQLEHNQAIGKTAIEVASLEAARLDEAAATAEQTAQYYEQEKGNVILADQYREQARLLRDLAKAKTSGAASQVAVEEAKKATEAWQRASEKINDTLTDALMRGFESGKGFAAALRDTVVNMFKTLVLRPIVSAIVSPVAGAITGALGFAGAANAASATGNALSTVGAISSLASGIGALGSGIQAGFGAMLNGGLFEAVSTGVTAAFTGGTLGTAMAGIGVVAGAVGPLIAVAALLKSLDDSGTMHTGGLGSYSAGGGSAYGNTVKQQSPGFFDLAPADYQASTEQASAKIAQSIVEMLDATANTFGQKAGYYAAAAFADDSSRSGAWGGLIVKIGDQIVADWGKGGNNFLGREFADGKAGAEQYSAAVGVAVRDLLIQQTPEWADTMLRALGDAPSLEQLAQTVAQINAIANSFEALRNAGSRLADLTDGQISELSKQFGGASEFAKANATYLDVVTTSTQKANIAYGQLAKSIADAGTGIPNTTVGLTKMVKGLDLTTEAGRNAYATLLKVAPAVAQLEAASLQIIGLSADATSAIFRDFLAGKTSGAEAGRALGDAVVNGVNSAMQLAGSQVMQQAMNSFIIQPLVASLMKGQTFAEAAGAMNVKAFTAVAAVAKQAVDEATAYLKEADIGGLLTESLSSLGGGTAAANGSFDTFAEVIGMTADSADGATPAVDSTASSIDALTTSARSAVNPLGDVAAAVDSVRIMSERAVFSIRTVTSAANAYSAGASNSVTGAASAGAASGRASLTVPHFAVGTNYVPNDMLAMIHEGERIMPAADNAALMTMLSSATSTPGIITSAFAGVGSDLSTRLDAILAELQKQGVDTGGSSYIDGLRNISDTFEQYRSTVLQAMTSVMNREIVDKAMQEAGYLSVNNIHVLGQTGMAGSSPYESAKMDLANMWQQLNARGLGNFSGWQDVAGMSPEALKSLAEQIVQQNTEGMLQWLAENKDNLAGGPMEGYANAIEQYQKSLEELQAQMQEQASNILDPLKADIAGQTESPFKKLADQAAEYIAQLDGLGQATEENVALVEQWREVMTQNARDNLYAQLLPDSEAAALATQKLADQFKALGVDLPDSTDAFRSLLDGIDTSAAGGQDLYDALLQLIPAFKDLEASGLGAGGQLAGLLQQQKELEAQLMGLQGNTEGAREALRALATEGMSEAEIAAYDTVEGLKEQIRVQTSLNEFAKENTNLQAELLQLQGKDAEAKALLRDLAIEGMSAEEIAAYDANQALRDRIDALKAEKQAIEEATNAQQGLLDRFGGQQTTEQATQALQAAGLDTSGLSGMGSDAIAAWFRDIVAAADPLTADGQKLIETFGGLSDEVLLLMSSADEAARHAEQVANERAGLERQLLQLNGDTAAIRELERNALDETNRALYDQIKALEDQQAAQEAARRAAEAAAAEAARKAEQVANERKSLEDQLLQLQGNTAAIRERERNALDESNRALYDQIKALEDQAEAARKAAEVAAERKNIEQELLQTLGDTARLRELELAALDPANRALQQMLYTLQDASAGMDAALEALDRAATAQKERIQKEAQTRIEALQKQLTETNAALLDAAKETASAFGAIAKAAADGAKRLRDSIDPQGSMQAARAYIDMALSVVRAGGKVDQDKLGDAISRVTSDTTERYATLLEFQRAQAIQAGKLQELAALSEGKATDAQRTVTELEKANTAIQEQIKAIEKQTQEQLAAIDDQVKAARDAVNVLRGIDISVLTVAEAVAKLDASMAVYMKALQDAKKATAPASTVAPASVAFASSASQPLQVDNTDMLAELRALRTQNERLEAKLSQIERHSQRTANATNGLGEAPLLVETV